jgi:hypothetical protein
MGTVDSGRGITKGSIEVFGSQIMHQGPNDPLPCIGEELGLETGHQEPIGGDSGLGLNDNTSIGIEYREVIEENPNVSDRGTLLCDNRTSNENGTQDPREFAKREPSPRNAGHFTRNSNYSTPTLPLLVSNDVAPILEETNETDRVIFLTKT